MNVKRTFTLVLFVTCCSCVACAQDITLDWKLHDVGQVRQFIANRGALNKLGTDYPGLINTEYPPGSFIEHMGDVGWSIGAVTPGGDTLVSVGRSWGSPSESEMVGYGDEPWDTVWVNTPATSHEIPYAVPYPTGSRYEPGNGGYSALSDQDLVTRYNDYNPQNLQWQYHQPLFVDVIQSSYAWNDPPMDEIILVNYWVTPTQHDLHDVYVSTFVDGNVGLRENSGYFFANGDYVTYRHELKMGIAHDAAGEYSPMGVMLIPPVNTAAHDLTWTWLADDFPPLADRERYLHMSSGERIDYDGDWERGIYTHGVGPYEVAAGDTLHFKLAIVLGENENHLLRNAEIVEWIHRSNFVPMSAERKMLHLDFEEGVGPVVSKGDYDVPIEMVGAPEYVAGDAPLGDYAMRLDGDSYLEIGAEDAVFLNGQEFVVDMWFRPEVYQTMGTRLLIHEGADDWRRANYQVNIPGHGDLAASSYNPYSGSSSPGLLFEHASDLYRLDWWRVVYVVSGDTSYVRIYDRADLRYEKGAVWSGAVNLSGGSFYIGGHSPAIADRDGDGSLDGPLFRGMVDEIKIFNYVPEEYMPAPTASGETELPGGIRLAQNYPNPFRGSTTVQYTLPRAMRVSMDVYDVLGRRVMGLRNGLSTAGTHRVEIDAAHLAAGVYVFRLKAGEAAVARRMIRVD